MFRDTEWKMATRVTRTELAASISAASPATDPALAMIRHVWPQVLTVARKSSRSLSAFLYETAPLEVNGGDLVIATWYQFHFENLDTERMRGQVEAVLLEVTGAAWRVRFVLRPAS
jgi:hypothetical protein